MKLQYLTVAEVASVLRMGRTTAYQLIAEGKIPSFRVGSGRGTILVSQGGLEDYLKRCHSNPKPERQTSFRRPSLGHLHIAPNRKDLNGPRAN